MTSIADINVYNDGMRKSMMDKLWFLDKIDDSVSDVYDYGCADGSLLKMIGEICPNMHLSGYDFNEEMINLAKKNVPNALFSMRPAKYSTLPIMVLNASSVFHEIHAYSNDIGNEYQNIFGINAKYIAIRDMFYSKTSCHPTNPLFLARVLQKENPNKIAEFESFQGSLTENKNFLQYLLTYRYETNWDREVRENYFPHSIEEFLNKIPDCYEIVYFEHYTLPYIRDKVKEDFGFTLSDPTHAKILLKLKNN